MKTSSSFAISMLLISAACSNLSKPAFDAKKEEAAIRAELDAQQIAWNNGDLEGFMQGYWNSDSLQFISGRGVNHGWKEALAGYKKAYPDIAAMGTVSFDLLQITPLSEINFVVMGKYHVVRSEGNLDGVFTLIFKKVNGKWRIVYDHTA